jgi:hypothetical protein
LNDYSQFLAVLLPLGGGALQWMRADRTVPESRTFALSLCIALAVYALCLDWTSLPQGVGAVQRSILEGIAWIGTVGIPSVLGGTFTASKLASSGRVPVIPETNSK